MILAGIGTAVPSHCIEQTDAARHAHEVMSSTRCSQRSVSTLYRRCGVSKRHSVLLGQSTGGRPVKLDSFFRPQRAADDRGPSTAERMATFEQRALSLALPSAERALADAAVEPESITHLVTATCSGFSSPGFDLGLIESLPLGPEVQRTQVGFMGCHGALNALRVAGALAIADPRSVVLVNATELCTLHFQYRDNPQTIVSNALFADGSASVVALAAKSGRRSSLGRIAAHGSAVVPGTADLMTWRIGDHGFEMSLSPRVPELIRRRLPGWIDGWLARQGLRRSDVRSWAIHPGGPRILQSCVEALEIAPESIEPSLDVLSRYGNMSSPTVLFILDELRRLERPRPTVMLAFGPGLTIEAALVVDQ